MEYKLTRGRMELIEHAIIFVLKSSRHVSLFAPRWAGSVHNNICIDLLIYSLVLLETLGNHEHEVGRLYVIDKIIRFY